MASYPTSIKSFSDVTDNVTQIQATQINQAYDEIEAIETALGAGLANVVTQALADAVGDLIAGTADGEWSRFPIGADGQILTANSASTAGMSWVDRDGAIEFTIGAGYAAITTDTVIPAVEVPANFTIEACRLYANASGSITLDVCKSTYANLPMESPADSIVASAPPTLSGAQKSENTTLTGWTTTLTKGDWIQPFVTSAATCKWVTLSLTGKITAVS